MTTMACLTGTTSGTVAVGSISSSTPRKYAVKCLRPGCGSSWQELHSHLVTLNQAGLVLQCRNSSCYLGHIRPPKERIAQPKPPAPQPKPLPPPQPAPAPQDAYSAYYRHAALEFDWVKVATREEFESYSPRGRAFLADGMARDRERQREQEAPGVRYTGQQDKRRLQ
jgi:hypothetical protein